MIATNSVPLLYATYHQGCIFQRVKNPALAGWSCPPSTFFALVQGSGVIGCPCVLSKHHRRSVNGGNDAVFIADKEKCQAVARTGVSHAEVLVSRQTTLTFTVVERKLRLPLTQADKPMECKCQRSGEDWRWHHMPNQCFLTACQELILLCGDTSNPYTKASGRQNMNCSSHRFPCWRTLAQLACITYTGCYLLQPSGRRSNASTI